MWESRDLVGTDAVESTRVMRERLWVENRCVQLTWAHTLLNESKALEGDDWLSQKSASNYPLMKAFTSISVMTRVVKTSNLSRTWHLEPHKKVLHTEPFLSAWLSYSMELAGGGGGPAGKYSDKTFSDPHKIYSFIWAHQPLQCTG